MESENSSSFSKEEGVKRTAMGKKWTREEAVGEKEKYVRERTHLNGRGREVGG